jgi:hypothetical protein
MAMLNFVRITQSSNSQSEIKSRVIRLTENGNFTYYNSFAHNIPNIAAPINNGQDYILHHKNGSAYWETVSDESEKDPLEGIIQLLDDNGTLTHVTGELLLDDLAMINTKLIVIKHIDEETISFDMFEFSGVTGGDEAMTIIFANGNKRITFNGEAFAYAETVSYTKAEVDAAIAAAIAEALANMTAE